MGDRPEVLLSRLLQLAQPLRLSLGPARATSARSACSLASRLATTSSAFAARILGHQLGALHLQLVQGGRVGEGGHRAEQPAVGRDDRARRWSMTQTRLPSIRVTTGLHAVDGLAPQRPGRRNLLGRSAVRPVSRSQQLRPRSAGGSSPTSDS